MQDVDKTKFRKRIKLLRRLYYAMLILFLPIQVAVGGILYVYQLPVWLVIIYAVLMFALTGAVYATLNRTRCPECDDYFFIRKMTKENYTPASSISFPMQDRCQKCGFKF